MPTRYCTEDDYTLLDIKVEAWPSDRRHPGEFSEEELARIARAWAEIDWMQGILEERCPKLAKYR